VLASELGPNEVPLPDPAFLAAERLRDDCRDLTSALDVEWIVSTFLPFWGDSSRYYDMDGIEQAGLGLVDALEYAGDTTALVVLRGFAAIGHSTLAAESTAAANGMRRVCVPTWAEDIGRAQATDALALSDPEGDGWAGVFIEYKYPSGARHSVAAYIDHDRGGIAKHLSLVKQIDDLPPADGLPLEKLSVDEAGALLRDALAATDPEVARVNGDSTWELGALAWARVRD
jgi:hypothetical protein